MTTRQKWLIGALVALLLALQPALWFRNGLLDLWELRGLNRTAEAENRELEERNRVLERDITNLKSGLGGIEKEAREELGMIKQGETFFRVIEQAPGEE